MRATCGLAALFLCAAIGVVKAEQISADVREAYRRPLSIPFPEGAKYSPQVATLGKMLFFDPRLSDGQNISCASCHNPSFGWEAPVDGAIGSQNTKLGRQAPTILDAAWTPHFFWDGRSPTLEHQAAGPITADVEMNGDFDVIVGRLAEVQEYADWFERLFPGEGLKRETILTAIATYERTVVSGWAPFDRWIEGDETAISDAAKRGFKLFIGKAQCSGCHSGWAFTDYQFHDIGLETADVGRSALEPDNPLAMHAFKTPSLRDVLYRAPYMHNGSVDSIDGVLYHYVGGGIERESLSPLMASLEISDDDIADLKAFLGSLTADEAQVPTPILPTKK